MSLCLRRGGHSRVFLRDFEGEEVIYQDVKTMRRDFLGTSMAILGTAAAPGPSRVWADAPEKPALAGVGVTPTKDLMKEQGGRPGKNPGH
jgi:hypothetical protein